MPGVRFDFQAYSCGEVLMGTEHVFRDVSFAWESHTNLSWQENPGFGSNSLDALLAFYVNNASLGRLLSDQGIETTPAEIHFEGDLDKLVVRLLTHDTRLRLALQGVDGDSDVQSSVLHIVPPNSGFSWLRFDVTETKGHLYGPWSLEGEGDSATARMANSAEGTAPWFEGRAVEGFLEITPEGSGW